MPQERIRSYFKSLSVLPLTSAFTVIVSSVLRKIFNRRKERDLFVEMEVMKWIFSGGGKVNRDKTTVIASVNFGPGSKSILLRLRRATSDFHVFRQVFMEEEYAEILKMVKDHSSPINIVDAGANIGTTSLWLKTFFPLARVYAIEADNENFKCLEANFKLNQMEQDLIPLHRALWNNDDELSVISDFRDGRSHSKSVSDYAKGNTTVKGITVDEIKSMIPNHQIDVFKIDIEGAEKQLFADQKKAGQIFTNIGVIAIEVHPEHIEETMVVNFFKNIGYNEFRNGETHFFNRKDIISYA